jgi:predicted HicB family RNase H-like nuclease
VAKTNNQLGNVCDAASRLAKAETWYRRITVRIPPSAQARAAARAAEEGKSLARWAQEQLVRALESHA